MEGGRELSVQHNSSFLPFVSSLLYHHGSHLRTGLATRAEEEFHFLSVQEREPEATVGSLEMAS